jgi:hypothetical protein
MYFLHFLMFSHGTMLSQRTGRDKAPPAKNGKWNQVLVGGIRICYSSMSSVALAEGSRGVLSRPQRGQISPLQCRKAEIAKHPVEQQRE